MTSRIIITNWKPVVSRLMETDGYLVYGNLTADTAVGSIIPDPYGLGIPLRITGMATWEDANRQFRLMIEMDGGNPNEYEPPPKQYFFYKTVAAD